LAFDLEENLRPVSSLMERYANLRLSLADACLVRMCELTTDSLILTLDRNFRIYRPHRAQRIPLLMPDEA
jgi:hypothetical protein